MKRIALALFASFSAMFILGGLWNALLMEDFYINNSPSIIRNPEDFNLLAIALGYLVLTSIMLLIAVQNFKVKPKFLDIFMFGATFGLAATLPLYLILWGRWDFSISYAIVDSIWHIFEQGIGAWILCMVLFYKKVDNKKQNS